MVSSSLVSIISPTYNHERYVADCIRSVQAQTYANWEMLIINDGSTDKTPEIAAEFAKVDPRIKIFNRENIGIMRLAEAYNFALDQSRGKYISVLECDDVWERQKLEWQVAALDTNPQHVLAWGRAKWGNSDLTKITDISPVADNPLYNNDPPGSILNLLYKENCITALTITVKRSALVEVGGFKQSFGLPLVDLPTWLELAMIGTFHYDSRVLGTWRISASQVTKSYPVEILKGRRDLVFDHYNRLPSSVKANVSLNRNELEKYFRSRLQITYARSGRYKLIRKDFKGARKDYIKSLMMNGLRNPAWKLRAAIGILMSWLRLDVEWLVSLLGRTTYKNK